MERVLIGKILRENNIGFVELNCKMPVKSRGELIRKFETNPQYKIFLPTEAGGSGLFKMATGKEMGMEGRKIEVNKETGEVTMKFKLPV